MSKIVLWVSDLVTQQAFYEALLGVSNSYQSEGFSSITNDANTVLLHKLPQEYRVETPIRQQLPIQSEVAIKPIFRVESIESALVNIVGTLATIRGEKVLYGQSTYLDIVDPEGNVIQIEEIQT